jgi:hypothetical protein
LHIPDAPVSCTDVNFLSNKVKGDSAFSPKTKSPSGVTAGDICPKNGPIFFPKKLYFKNAKYVSTRELGRTNVGRERPKGEDG